MVKTVFSFLLLTTPLMATAVPKDFPKPEKVIQFDNREECLSGYSELRRSGSYYKTWRIYTELYVINDSYIVDTATSCQENSIKVWNKSDVDNYFSLILKEIESKKERLKISALEKIRLSGVDNR